MMNAPRECLKKKTSYYITPGKGRSCIKQRLCGWDHAQY